MSGASKIPPHIARELKRHVRPRTVSGPTSAAGSSAGKNAAAGDSSSNGKFYTFLGCTASIHWSNCFLPNYWHDLDPSP